VPDYVAGLFALGSQCFWTNLRNFSGVVEPQTNPQSKQAKAPLVSPVPPYSVNENDRKPSGLKTAAPSSPRILPLMIRELLHFRHWSMFGSIDQRERRDSAATCVRIVTDLNGWLPSARRCS